MGFLPQLFRIIFLRFRQFRVSDQLPDIQAGGGLDTVAGEPPPRMRHQQPWCLALRQPLQATPTGHLTFPEQSRRRRWQHGQQ